MVSAVVFTYCSIYGGYCRQREIRYRYVAKWQKLAFIDRTSDRKVIDDRPSCNLHDHGQIIRDIYPNNYIHYVYWQYFGMNWFKSHNVGWKQFGVISKLSVAWHLFDFLEGNIHSIPHFGKHVIVRFIINEDYNIFFVCLGESNINICI